MIKRGDIYFAELSPYIGSEQGGRRPALIVQNDTGNRHSPTVIVAAMTTRLDKARLPTHVFVDGGSCGLLRDSVVLLEQIRTIDKSRLLGRIGRIDGDALAEIDRGLKISLGLD